MFFLTHKWTKKLHLHWLSYKILKSLFPFFRTLGRKFIRSTRMYKNGWDSITQKGEYRPASYLEVQDPPTHKPPANDKEETKNTEPLGA